MKMDFFQNQTLDAMEAYMGRLSQRQQVVSSNLANIDTPGYRTRDISFHATMQDLLSESVNMQTSHPRHVAPPPGIPHTQVFEPQGLQFRADGNNVDLDKEMLKLSQTSFGYTLMAQLVQGKFRKLSMSINEGSGR